MFPKNLFNISDLSPSAIEEIMSRAAFYKKRKNEALSPLKGKNIVLSFWEPSTRTRVSFEIAVQRLGGRVINYSPDNSSEKKGENLKDTLKTLAALGADAVVFRHRSPGFFNLISQMVDIPFISGGEGCYQHPTQALLDLFTLRDRGVKLSEIKVIMVGDILYSRVARSHFYALSVFGAGLTLVAPPVLLPAGLVPDGVSWSYALDDLLPEGDVVYLLRVQRERQGKALLPSLAEYAALYGINEKRIPLLKKGALLMHPGPVNIGIEISRGAVDFFQRNYPERILFQEQALNGVFVRMAVLDLLLGGK